jgi:hypothetical protein
VKRPELSGGAKRDLLILYFAMAIIKVSLGGKSSDTIERDRSNRMHRVNARVDRRMNRIVDMAQQTINDVMTPDLARWVESKTKGSVFSLLSSISDTVMQLDTLAYYILYVNFCERKKPLHEAFRRFTDADLYFDDIDLIKQAGINDDQESGAMKMAYQIVSELKG